MGLSYGESPSLQPSKTIRCRLEDGGEQRAPAKKKEAGRQERMATGRFVRSAPVKGPRVAQRVRAVARHLPRA
jgi:hypothetical protein